jgi:uncharacterized protein
MKYLIFTIRKLQFNMDYVSAHYEYLDRLKSETILEQFGPFTDKSGGAYLINAPSLDVAQKIAFSDPLYINDCSDFKIYEWDTKV